MPTYEYKCQGCGDIREITCAADDKLKQDWDMGAFGHSPYCPECDGSLVLSENCERCHGRGRIICGDYRRRFSFSTGPIFQPHLNGTTGTYVTSRAQFNDELKRISERETLRTGIDSTITPIDHQEQVKMFRDAHGDVGLKEQHDGQVKRGEKESRGKFVHPIT